MSKQPKVSVVTVTYNQEQYVRQALDSFVSQRTDFPFEVVIADDCSTDSTPEIIKEYAERHPDIFKPILRKKNLGVGENFKGAMQAATGEYIALCEGDDYWTDDTKLQKQADFLDKNPKHGLCFHPVTVFFESGDQESYVYPGKDQVPKLTTAELLRENFIQTNSVMYRRQNYDDLPTHMLPVDWYLHLYHAKFGKIGFINRTMSAYRRHPGGLWWNSHSNIEKIWAKYGLPHLALYVEFDKLYGGKAEYQSIINRHLANMLAALVETDEKQGSNLIAEAVRRFPDNIQAFIIGQHEEIKRLAKVVVAKESEVHELNLQAQRREQALAQLREELTMIKSSRAWKL
ncbi:MAG TPA: glycosyltransferase, partial [Verrucomicrobiae bacterium]|nr:glycosyltransferase [Verrucomicrobiae bacterium]